MANSLRIEITGDAGAGKTRLARSLLPILETMGKRVTLRDGVNPPEFCGPKDGEPTEIEVKQS